MIINLLSEAILIKQSSQKINLSACHRLQFEINGFRTIEMINVSPGTHHPQSRIPKAYMDFICKIRYNNPVTSTLIHTTLSRVSNRD